MSPLLTPKIIHVYFCENVECDLHVTDGNPGVSGSGDWAEIDGRILSRRHVGRHMFCDECAALHESSEREASRQPAEPEQSNKSQNGQASEIDPADTLSISGKHLAHVRRMIKLMQEELRAKDVAEKPEPKD